MGSEGADIINNSVVITLMPRQFEELQFTPELTESIKNILFSAYCLSVAHSVLYRSTLSQTDRCSTLNVGVGGAVRCQVRLWR